MFPHFTLLGQSLGSIWLGKMTVGLQVYNQCCHDQSVALNCHNLSRIYGKILQVLKMGKPMGLNNQSLIL
jgi:hypothetical protein